MARPTARGSRLRPGQPAREADGSHRGRQTLATYRRAPAGAAAHRGDACGQKHRSQGLPPAGAAPTCGQSAEGWRPWRCRPREQSRTQG
ncbi:hypothetical protein GW17_00060281 [Ensete ventricosum]|nr:hypothetical protein GW17_00060281 [Ensete ventricosum]